MKRSPFARCGRRRRGGQSLIESCLAIALIGLAFAGLFQVSQILAAREVLGYAAACGARARTVGFNRWMVTKAVRVAAIPCSGRLLEPDFENIDPQLRSMVAALKPGALWSRVLGLTPASAQYDLERARIPEYMDSPNSVRAHSVLHYEGWEDLRLLSSTIGGGSPTVRVQVGQDYGLWVPLHRSFYAADSVPLEGDVSMENHYPLYLDDLSW
jgi:hypothetical protein